MRGRAALLPLALALAAPTAGDIGSCGQEIADLDPAKFFDEKRQRDCQTCTECDFATETCRRACEGALTETSFPEGCFPLVHDGEVCLNALAAADCDEYAPYVDDLAPAVPTECNFCPPEARP
jgi:hypothetical protein